ncbi:Undecaprenyl pyrophosphate synthase, partial [Conidiobolus coronatus NRRL 28638]
LPKHVGIIMDGNRRYAKQRGLCMPMGHHLGGEKLSEIISTTQPLTLVETPLIPSLTVWAFSTDNFKRSPPELHELLNLFNQELTSILISGYLTRHRVRVTIFGEKNLLPEYLRETIHRVEVATREYPPLFNFQIAFPYGGRDEVAMAATRALHSKYLKPSLISDIGSSSPYSYIFNKTTPPPVDFIIRTSNEVRLSGFMLWDSALAEYCFMKCFWPDFSKLEFFNAIMDFTRREIRLGE